MGNWNRHFVRVGSDGNVSVYDTSGSRAAFFDSTQALNLIPNYDTDTGQAVIKIGTGNILLFNAEQYNNARPVMSSPVSTFKFYSGFSYLSYINGYGQGNNNSAGAMNAIGYISGSPDLRIGVTAADASAITIFSSTKSGVRYEVKARILATAGSSATYKIVWTEGGVAQSVSLTITAVDTEVHDNFVIAPDANTDITAQITSLTSSTVNVDAIVSVLG